MPLANSTYKEWLAEAGFVYTGSCYCGGFTEKYKNATGYEVHVKTKHMRYNIKGGGKLIAFGGIFNLKDKLYELQLIQAQTQA